MKTFHRFFLQLKSFYISAINRVQIEHMVYSNVHIKHVLYTRKAHGYILK